MFNLSEFISFVYESQVQSKLFHYQTTSYSQQVALGEFYDEFYEITDSIIENLAERYGRPVMNEEDQIMSIDNISEVDMDSWIESMENYFQDVKNDLDPITDSDVISKLDEVFNTISSLKFFFSLS